MADALVGGAFLSAFLQVLFDRMASREVVNFFGERKFNDQLLKRLKITLLSVNAVLNDAEEKQITNSTVKEWLDELKDAVYNAEDLIDEIATEASKCRLEAQLQTGTSKVWKLLGTSPSSFDKEIELKLQETLATLEFIVKQKDVLGLREGVAVKPSSRVPSTSLVDESGVYGRDEDKEAIVKFLLSDDAKGNKIGVVAIVGMGGVGKTTLAQLVYNDHRAEEHFELKVWVCVSEEFDVFRVTKTIFEAVAPETCHTEDLNLLQVKLTEILRRKKFLLVLDNVWNENYTNWEVLQSPFQSGAQGSKIIVTTRNENVASIMRTAPIHHLKQLPDEDCWLLFARYAFQNVDSCANPNLEVIGRGIAKKCKGLPLAAKTLGGLLRCKLDPKEWDELLRSDIWDFSDDASNILPALRLSYHYLPSHLKRCFAYCSIFPKDHEFQRQELVLLWMAEDFLTHPKGKKRMEEVGDEYFHELVSRSFFQQSSGEKSCFVMHDLVNDLAKFVSGEFCLRWEGEGSHKFVKTRHLSYVIKEHDVIKKFEAFYEAKCLRTLLLQSENAVTRSQELPDDLLLRLQCLRVLSLSGYLMTELPDSIGNLKHLRYLDLSHNAFERLPDTVCTLFNLHTLLLSGCFFLKELPKNMGRLINLRHLRISGTRLVEMPLQMSNLKDLQTLTDFTIGEHGDSSIRGLRELQHLRGTISISGLQNVVHPGEALEINLKDRKYLTKLTLRWGGCCEDSQNGREVFDKLQPHANLEELAIKGYSGTRFPDWLGYHSFCNLTILSLQNCENCFFLPPLGQLPSLRELYVIRMTGVVTVGLEFYGDCSHPFQCLEILRFEKMKQWQEWFSARGEDDSRVFPCLQELYILDCPNLTGSLPNHLPSLTKLWIYYCPQLVASIPGALAIRELQLGHCEKVQLNELPLGLHMLVIQGYRHLESLPNKLSEIDTCVRTLYITDCSSLTSLPGDALLSKLQELYIENSRNLQFPMHLYFESIGRLQIQSSCDSMKSFPLDFFPKLYFLDLRSCKNLESLTVSEGTHSSLVFLEIDCCPNFVSFPSGGLNAPDLAIFIVNCCEELKSLPEKMHILLPSLVHMELFSCLELESFPEGGLSSNLESLEIKECDRLVERWMEWDLQRLTRLSYLRISSKSGVVESFPDEGFLPTSLTSLYIALRNLKTLDSKGFQHLTSLKELEINFSPELQHLPEEGLPPSISYLKIIGCPLLEERCQ